MGCDWLQPDSLLQPDYGEPDPMCGFAPGTQLAWAGHGDPAAFGLMEQSSEEAIPGDIYVEAEPVLPRRDGGMPDEPVVCVIVAPGHSTGTEIYEFTVPDGWEPP